MTDFAVADTHFGHHNIIEYCERPYKSVKEMDEDIINRWNDTVSPSDKVYFLGDFMMGPGTRPLLANYRAELNGYIIMMKGNHDHFSTRKLLEAGFDEVIKGEIFWYQPGLAFTHRPLPIKYPGANVHGHVHNLMHMSEGNVYYCVSVEQTDYRPVKINYIIDRLGIIRKREEDE